MGYLDGLSQGLHGAPKTKEFDAMVTGVLKMLGWKVHHIPYSALSDPVMRQHHLKVAQSLGGVYSNA